MVHSDAYLSQKFGRVAYSLDSTKKLLLILSIPSPLPPSPRHPLDRHLVINIMSAVCFKLTCYKLFPSLLQPDFHFVPTVQLKLHI